MKRVAVRIITAAILALGAVVAQAQTDPRAQIISPTPGSTLPGSTVTFTWSPAAGGGDYFLQVESVFGAHDIFYAVVRVTSVTLTNLPTNGGTIYLTLFTQLQGAWQTPFQYTFKAAGSGSQAPTTTTVASKTVAFSSNAQNVTLTATVAGASVNQGTASFQIKDGAANIGTAVTSTTVANGIASVAYPLPAGMAPKAYTIQTTYSGGPQFQSSTGTGTLNVVVDPALTMTFNLPPDGASMTSSGAGNLSVIYGAMSSTTAKPAAIANFGYRNGAGILQTEAGVPAAKALTAARMFVDYSATSNFGFALVNPGRNPITIQAILRDANGTAAGSTQVSLGAGAHLAKFVSELFPALPTPFLGTLTLTGSDAFAAINLSAAMNIRGEMLFSALPVADLANPPAGASLILPQVVDGAGNPTQIMLMNPSSTAQSIGKVQLFDDQGAPLALDFGDPAGPQSSLNFILGPDGMAKFATTGRGILRAGYAVVTVSSGSLPVGSGIFQLNQGPLLISQAGVLDSPPTTAARLYIETASAPLARTTGIAIANPNPNASLLTLTLVGFDGTTRSTTVTLAPNAHVAKFITELFPGSVPADFRGVLNVTSSQPDSIMTLRLTVNERGESLYSTLPVADLNNPPAGAMYLSQVVNGGGYKTQVVVINAMTGPGAVYLNFYDAAGAGVPLIAIQ